MLDRSKSSSVAREVVLRPEVFAGRRRLFMDAIGTRAAAIFPAAPTAIRSNDVEYPYRSDNDLLYLTGFSEPEAVCVLLPGHPEEEFVMFVLPRDPERETWTGRRAGVEGALAAFGAQRAYPIEQLDQKIAELVGERDQLYYRFDRHEAFNARVIGWMRQWHRLRPRSGKGPVAILDPGQVIHELRLRKGSEEVSLMRRAAEIAVEAHLGAMRAAQPGMFEFEIEAMIDSTFRRHGASGPAYPSIVASGENATILHYTANNRRIQAGDLLLIDAGAEYGNYCSDVTRTFPVRGGYRPEQRSIYELVLAAQQAAIAAVRPGSPYDEPHRRALDVLVDGLRELAILKGERGELLESEAYKPFYMHRTSHWLGMDVHDVGSYRTGDTCRVLEPGMVLTVEPGLYFSGDCQVVPAEYRGIGVRIEDDVLVTPEGCEVLTSAAPKSWAEMEEITRSGGGC